MRLCHRKTLTSAALFFGGRQALGSQGIESGFAHSAASQFRTWCQWVHAHDRVDLAERGTVPHGSSLTLRITNIVKGSFSFLLVEVRPQLQTAGSSLKTAIDEATQLLIAFGEDEEINQRVLAASCEFFDLMRKSGTTMRLVSDDTDWGFGSDVVASVPGRRRSSTATTSSGQLAGVLPKSHQFEFRAADERARFAEGRSRPNPASAWSL